MKRILLLTVMAGIAVAGCATTPDDPNRQTKEKATIGAAVGAIAGAVIGHQHDRSGGALRGALLGAAAGGALGAGVGAYMDRQEAEFRRVLEEERRANAIEIERLKNENLKITMNAEVSFGFDSAVLNPAFHGTLNKVADILKRYSRTTAKVIGHTDSRGSTGYNQHLSEQRANAVVWYLANQGVDSARMTAEGRGELQPRATNDTEAGRQLNRRVEMLIIPDRDIQ